ncbi:DUF4390 domain-containing protein [Pelomonas sp. KK5]|uniref:DUF4390 domain-containing protein n=1 Tax=Pelomonas sp. KK5 TaxID=1855730 RepID=UPI0009FB2587|nr:DUF4390 domain-containing protein [Pelomonas sp. KK5]
MSLLPYVLRALLRPGRLWCRAFALALACWLATLPSSALAAADGVELSQFSTHRSDEGLELSFSTRFELTRPAEDALMKGVPIYFLAEVQLLRHRWYWRDSRVGRVTRSWRLEWKPLLRQYKVTSGAFNQSFASLPEALASLRGVANWRVADAKELDGDGGYYLEFSYRLDTTQLPRPMQIDLGPAQGFGLSTERTVQLAADLTPLSISP